MLTVLRTVAVTAILLVGGATCATGATAADAATGSPATAASQPVVTDGTAPTAPCMAC
ncbi:hypothetical protein ACFW1A_32100 [Kitasatospora sp. NPDC058965]|uniref:hypothetical protein n=1 Tax=Kitasatospora sp. NPDC058965 TaxID=3346682 RepID=UPI00368C05BD